MSNRFHPGQDMDLAKELLVKYPWLNEADFKDALVSEENGKLVWEGGTWEKGTWKNGTWVDGTWMNGTWYDGTWKNGTWKNGTWKGGWTLA
jgi:hypothetical protein